MFIPHDSFGVKLTTIPQIPSPYKPQVGSHALLTSRLRVAVKMRKLGRLALGPAYQLPASWPKARAIDRGKIQSASKPRTAGRGAQGTVVVSARPGIRPGALLE